MSTIPSVLKTISGPVSETEELSLWKNYKQTGDIALRNQLVLKYAGLVEIIVKRMYSSFQDKVSLEDLVSNGMIALIKSVESFDINKEVRFGTYASIRIRGSVIDYIRRLDWIPRTVREKSKQIDTSAQKLKKELGRPPTNKEIADDLGVSERKLDEQMSNAALSNILSLEELIYEKISGYSLEDKDAAEPQLLLIKKELVAKLAEAIDSLGEKERLVITLFYYEELKIKDIAKVLEITSARVSQIHSAALNKIRLKLNEYMEG